MLQKNVQNVGRRTAKSPKDGRFGPKFSNPRMSISMNYVPNFLAKKGGLHLHAIFGDFSKIPV